MLYLLRSFSLGRFGAMFYPPARGTSGERLKKQPTVYTSRPGQRLWTADTNGKVLSTLMYKGLTNENPPGIMILNPLPPPTLTKLPPDYQPQFGPLRLLHGQFFVTWDTSRLWVLDPSPCALVGYHGNLGDIVDVSTAGHEIYVLQRGGERRLMKLSLIPRLANPLVDVVALMEHSYKIEEEETTKQPQLERNKQLQVVNNVSTRSYNSLTPVFFFFRFSFFSPCLPTEVTGINPFPPEPPVITCANPRPSYRL